MKITTIQGSPKKKGNTATILTLVEAELESMGHEVSRIDLNNKDIQGCLGCYKCQKTPDAVACVQKDETKAILNGMIQSDAVLLASPVYFWSVSAQLKTLIDRSFALVTQYATPNHTSLLQGKPIALLATGEDDYEENKSVFPPIDKFFDFLLADKKEPLYVGECSKADDLAEKYRNEAKELAHRLVS